MGDPEEWWCAPRSGTEVAEGVMSKLIDFEDTQVAIFLLRLSFGIVRATHFMRTTPLSLWSKQAGEFDEKVSQTVFQCLGLKPTDEAYALGGGVGADSWPELH